MLRPLILLYSVLLFLPSFISAQENDTGLTRMPAFTGTFYPAGKAALNSALERLFSDAEQAAPEGDSALGTEKIQTIIVPHAGFDYSGLVSASGYQTIPKNSSYDNIFIITTSHREQFDGISVCLAGSYHTSLGELKVNRQLATRLIKEHPTILYRPEAHEREQGIEVQLPFIRYHFDSPPPIIPIVMGSSSLAAARDLATALLPWFTPENLFIISADFSRYPSYTEAKRIDHLTADAISSGNPERFYKALSDASRQKVSGLATPSGDWSSIMTLLYMADQGNNLIFKPLLYRNSGDSPLGDRQRVVGYWALAACLKTKLDSPLELTEEEKAILLGISRSTLESYIRNESIPELPGDKLPSILLRPASSVVGLHMGNKLRGRVEYLAPAIPLSAMVQEMTLASATLDHRFAPVEASDLEYITIEISIIFNKKKILGLDEIDMLKHGIYLVKNDHTGLYLPGKAAKENWTLEELLSNCARERAGLGWDEWKDSELYIFEAITFSETDLNPSPSPAL